jgi:hypothetical protein
MDNPSNVMFHKLIRRSRNSTSRNKEAACIIENGEHHYNAIDQTNSFTRFFEDLAIPKDKVYDYEFLELCNIRHNIIQQMCEYEDVQETNIRNFVTKISKMPYKCYIQEKQRMN